MAPVSTRGPQATFLKTIAPNPLLRSRSPAQKTFGAATGVSDPRLQKTRIRNNHAGGKAATVAGDAGPGFDTWPPGHIPQDTNASALIRIRSPAQKTFGEATYAAFLQNAGLFFRVHYQGWHPGLVCDAPSGHRIGNAVGEATGVSAPPGTPTSRRPVLNAPEGPSGVIVSGT